MDGKAYGLILRRLSALERRVSAVFRTGKVAEVQLSPYRVRVDIGPDEDGEPVLTDLLPVVVPRSGEVRTWSPLTVGERTAVLSPGGEDASAFVWPALVSAEFDAVSGAAGEEVERWDALGAPGTEVGRTRTVRAGDVAGSSHRMTLGTCEIRLAGDGTLTITNGTARITLSGSDVTVAADRVDYVAP